MIERSRWMKLCNFSALAEIFCLVTRQGSTKEINWATLSFNASSFAYCMPYTIMIQEDAPVENQLPTVLHQFQASNELYYMLKNN